MVVPLEIPVVDGTSSTVKAVIRSIPVRFKNPRTHLNFDAVEDPPFDVSIGFATLKEIEACLDFGNHKVTVTTNGKTSVLDLDYDYTIPSLISSGTESEDFTSDSELVHFSTSSGSEIEDDLVLSVKDEAPFEPDMFADQGDEDIPNLPEGEVYREEEDIEDCSADDAEIDILKMVKEEN